MLLIRTHSAPAVATSGAAATMPACTRASAAANVASWEDRYHSFHSRWDPAAGAAMAAMRAGESDGDFILYTAVGANEKGVAHEAPMAPCRLGARAVSAASLHSARDGAGSAGSPH